MWLKMKNFKNMKVEKFEFWGGVHDKPIYRENCLKEEGLDSFQF